MHNTNWQSGSFCKDGWISYRWNRSIETPYPDHDFEIFLNPKSPTEIVPMDVAARNVAKDIHQTYKNKKLFLAMSGGIDSEYVAVTLKKMNIEFTPIIVQVEQYNQMDAWWVHYWCKQNNIQPITIDITLSNFFLEFLRITKRYWSNRVQAAAIQSFCCDYVNKHNGILIGGGGIHELYIPDPIMPVESKDPTLEGKVGYLFNEADLIKHLVCEDKLKLDTPTMFFNWNPEIILSYIAARNNDLTTEENRFKIFNLNPRPKIGAPVTNDFRKYLHINDPVVQKTCKVVRLFAGIGTSDSCYLGNTETLMKVLKNEK